MGRKGRVFRCDDRSSNETVVIKMLFKSRHVDYEVKRRDVLIALLNIPIHDHLLQYKTIYEDESCYYIISEDLKGRELFEFVSNERVISEEIAIEITRSLLSALKHLHVNKLIHRDVKLENAVWSHEKGPLKLIDLDTCGFIGDHQPDNVPDKLHVGTDGYTAPECIGGGGSQAGDLFAVGVIVFAIMTKQMPFKLGMNAHSMLETAIDWYPHAWAGHPLALDLCQRLMSFKLEERLQTAQEALEHIKT